MNQVKILLKTLWRHIEKRRKKQLSLVVVLMMLSSVAEVVAIGAVIPFLGVLGNPERVFQHEYTQGLIIYTNITESDQLLLPLSVAFAIAALLSGGMRIFLLWAQTRIAHAMGADLSYQIYKRTLYQPYSVHISRNSSEVIAAISTKASAVVASTILPVLNIITAFVMIVMILSALIVINPVMSIAATAGFAAIYFVIIALSRRHLVINGQQVSRMSNKIIKTLQEGLGGIRDVLIDGTQGSYCAIFRSADISLRRAVANNSIIGQSPRYGVEALGIVLIVIISYLLSIREEGLVGALPLLGALAVGAQRILPMLQNAYGALSQLSGGQAVLRDALLLLEQPLPEYAEGPTTDFIPFQKSIKLEELAFRYEESAPWVLKGVDFEIEKGTTVGFIGTTGSGKSTLLDVIMALLHPTKGRMRVDDDVITDKNHRGWQSHIAHIPQEVFLSDSTVAENIAFGVSATEIDYSLVEKAAIKAQIHETIVAWDKQYHTQVGERGVRLSGGQRQRIGIARALYKQVDVLILDEATSALDNETELAVMKSIYNTDNDITVIIVAHRLTTLKGCKRIVELEDGKIKRIGSPEEIINQFK